jgi:hypothetical protein
MNVDIESPNGPTSAQRSGGAKWGQERRLEFIDFRLRWDGRFNRSDLTGFFGISIPQASLDIAEYTRRAPGNLDYDRTGRLYVAGAVFRPLFESSSLERYLDDLLRSSEGAEVPYGSFLGWHPPVAYATRPSRRISADVVVAVVRAIRDRLSLTLRYQSFSAIDAKVRLLSPHALVHDGFRWHMRAYCHSRRQYRDFLLSRVIEIQQIEPADPLIKEDVEWETMVKVVIAPHPDLAEAHTRIIELDYGMQNGVCAFECRQPLLFYVLQQLRLDEEESPRSPEAQQIILANRADLISHLPKSKFR